jgi:hypothetical protein
MSKIDDALWKHARALIASSRGLEISGLGTFQAGSFTPATSPVPPTGHDAPALVVAVAGDLGVSDDEVRGRLRDEVRQALDSANERPAPLGPLGLIERRGGTVRFHPARRSTPAPAGAVDQVLETWRTPAPELGERVDAVIAALEKVTGTLPVADLRRLLDELDYDLDEADWRRFGDRITAALPF